MTISAQSDCVMTIEDRIELATDNTLTHFYRPSGVPYFTYREGEPAGTIVPDQLDLDSADVDLACRHIELLSMIMARYPEARKHMRVHDGLMAWFHRLTDPNDGMLWANDSYDPQKSTLHTFGIDIQPLGRCISLHAERETLLALLGLMEMEEHREEAQGLFEKHVAFWDKHLHREGDARFAPHIFFRASGEFSGHWLYPLSDKEELFSMGPGRMIMPLVRFYDITGNNMSLELALGLARYLLHKSGDFLVADGKFEGFGIGAYHNHSNIMSIAGALLAADRAEDRALYARAKLVFDEALLPLCSPFGWTPEMLDRAARNHPHSLLDSIRDLHACETCCVANMIETAIVLAQTGHPEYWELAERFSKNHLFASQMTNADWVPDPEQRKMVLGSFSGRSDPNEFFVGGNVARCTMSCCHAEGTRALLLLHENTVTEDAEGISANLGFSVDTATLDLRVDIDNDTVRYTVTAKRAKSVRVRIPREAAPARGAFVDAPRWEVLSAPEPGRPYALQWPLKEAVTQWASPDTGEKFSVTWRGDQVVAIAPAGKRFPLYNER